MITAPASHVITWTQAHVRARIPFVVSLLAHSQAKINPVARTAAIFLNGHSINQSVINTQQNQMWGMADE